MNDLGITMKDVYRNVTIPQLLVLPAFCNTMEYRAIKMLDSAPMPLMMLMYEYGLQKAYLEADNNDFIILEFNNLVNEDLQLSFSPYHSMSVRLIDSQYFVDVTTIDGKNLYKMYMPENISQNIDTIRASNYSKMPSDFVSLSLTKQNELPVKRDNYGYFIMQHNIPGAVFKRSKTIRDIIEDELAITIPDNHDLVRKFDPELDICQHVFVS